MKVFISATCEDLNKDCRPAAVEAVRAKKVDPIDMTTREWTVTYRPPWDECQQKIETATHYLGVFAFWRGWILLEDTQKSSITEAEFDYALDRKGKKNIGVYLPEQGSEIEKDLLNRAHEMLKNKEDKEAAKAELSAQKQFLQRVLDSGTVNFFSASWDLALRVGTLIDEWRSPTLLELAGQEVDRPRQLPPPKQPILKIGLNKQVSDFHEKLEKLQPRTPGIHCGSGHRRLPGRATASS
jgi:hypothetical protein